MRWSLPGAIALVVAVATVVAVPVAGAARLDDGAPRTELVRNIPRAQPPADRIQAALALCIARGYRDGSPEQRRCAERLLGVSLPSSNSGSGSGQGGGSSPGGSGSSGTSGGATTPPATTTAATSTPSPPPPATTTTTPPPTTTTTPAPTPAPQPRGPVLTDRGIIQATGTDSLVLRALDGSSLTIPLDPRTRIYLGGQSAGFSALTPGAVAEVRHQSIGPAIDVKVQVPPKPKLRTDRAVTLSASPTQLVLRLLNGAQITVAMDGNTRVTGPNGRQYAPSDIVPGLLADVLYDPAGTVPAQSVKIIRRV